MPSFAYHPQVRSMLASLAVCGVAIPAAFATDYYVDNLGSDNNNGTSPSTAWATIRRVNNAALQPGDTVSFKRGGVWRGALATKGGSLSGGNITYGAYGTGAKPLLLGSAPLSTTADWAQTAANIWTSQVPAAGPQLLTNPGFDDPSWKGWAVYPEGSLITKSLEQTDVYPAATAAAPNPNSLKIKVIGSSSSANQIQLFTNVFQATYNACYKLSFYAKANIAVSIPASSFQILQSSNYNGLGVSLDADSVNIGTSWSRYERYFRATGTDSSVRVFVFLGLAAGAGTDIYLDSASLTACDEDKRIVSEVGNLVFDNEQSVGTRVWNEADLAADGQYWYDAANNRVKLYSVQNPASAHTRIEAAMGRNVISMQNQTDVVVRDLDLRYSARHGVQTVNVSRILLDSLDISYIGGAEWQDHVRLGNGIELYDSASNVVVQNNRISHAFDVAVTSQGSSNTNVVNNIQFLNNLLSNSEQCLELWNRPTTAGQASTTGVTFSGNTCLNSGYGWSHFQRAASDGSDLLFFPATAPMRDIHITNNIFYGARDYFIHLNTVWDGYQQIDLGGNCYYPAAGAYLLRAGDGNTPAVNYTTAAGVISVLPGASTSSYTDPQLVLSASGALVPSSSGSCSGKGYVPPSA